MYQRHRYLRSRECPWQTEIATKMPTLSPFPLCNVCSMHVCIGVLYLPITHLVAADHSFHFPIYFNCSIMSWFSLSMCFVGVDIHMLQSTCGGQKQPYASQFSSSTQWVPGTLIKIRFWGKRFYPLNHLFSSKFNFITRSLYPNSHEGNTMGRGSLTTATGVSSTGHLKQDLLSIFDNRNNFRSVLLIFSSCPFSMEGGRMRIY